MSSCCKAAGSHGNRNIRISMNRPIQRILAIAVGLVFLVTGVLKALDPSGFAIDIQNYRLIPWIPGVLLARYLPWLEILSGGALIFRIGYRGALLCAGLMLATFIVAHGSTRPRGLDVSCGCFGHGSYRYYWPVVIGDIILLAITFWLLKADFRRLSPILPARATTEA